MEERWDVIIVGARCAGATLAALLAHSGVRTLLLEASSRGTNMPMSTHLLQARGMDVLERLGLAERVRGSIRSQARPQRHDSHAHHAGHGLEPLWCVARVLTSLTRTEILEC